MHNTPIRISSGLYCAYPSLDRVWRLRRTLPVPTAHFDGKPLTGPWMAIPRFYNMKVPRRVGFMPGARKSIAGCRETEHINSRSFNTLYIM